MDDPTGTGTLDGTNPLSGILGSILGESAAAQKARIEEATKGAHDLTNLVKRKKATSDGRQDIDQAIAANGNGKRKVEFAGEVEEAGAQKKTKTENVVGE
jgi:HAT1-interacting factor 1